MNIQAQSAFPEEKGWRIWWRLTRPHTLTAAFVPVLLGTALSANQQPIHGLLFASMLVASLLIQAATNMFNEYYDYARGLDNQHSVGIGGAIVRHGVKPATVLGLGFAFLGAAVLLGVYISASSSWWIALVGLVSMAAGYFYTGGPYPIAYTPFGEITSGFFMGFVITQISYFIQTGSISLISVLVSMPISILIGAIMLSNNIRDLDGDKKSGRKTVAILVGREKAIKLLAAMFIVSYVFILILIFFFSLSPWLLLTFASIPKAIKAVKGFIGKTEPIQMMPAMKATAQTNTIFGFLMAASFFISYVIS
ncbi:1,4-dihydroxy-2-naphthoate polyprenyltransferase [Siminovitchia sp. FSL H7-0308]|uniref:1,4-dihydroxy-2-naphthoate octaprenyltransferase n=1 Tax=Siminovitchia thermophila TaxID=1245522 RepID=A0ABS2RBC7_9BACI|nr:1,4-dihydroxy-2-naphthoate polyprenyltransferase [Siminovitchia thermophila]MBM7715906.1 1,4-dihydroxy-2-naphthoate octaprenyltransferase [Siminovitchia thermophila]